MSHLIQKRFHRQVGQVSDLPLAFVSSERFLRLVGPVHIKLCRACDDEDVLGARMEPQGEVQRPREIQLDRNTDDVGRQLAGFDFPLFNGEENNGHAGKNLIAIFQRKIQRRGKARDNKIDFPPRKFLLQQLGLKLLLSGAR